MGAPREVARGDEGYPERLMSLSRPPERVYLEGPWIHAGPIVAVVGSRHANGDGLDFARNLAAELAHAGAAVISGLALGVDAAAHEGALDAGGVSGAVLGTPLDRVYPRRHAPLQRRLAHSLGLLSELALGTASTPGTFVSRNRLVAALADVVIVVQGREQSGALLTADFARGLGRPIGAVPWDPREELAAAPLSLLVAGHAAVVRHADDVLDLIDRAAGRTPPSPAKPRAARVPRRTAASLQGRASRRGLALDLFAGESEAKLLRSLRRFAEPLETAAARSGLSVAEAGAALILLELAGRAKRIDGGLVRLAPEEE